MANKLNTTKYNSEIGKIFGDYEVLNWAQSDNGKHINYTLKNIKTGEIVTKNRFYVIKANALSQTKTNFTKNDLLSGQVVTLHNQVTCMITNAGLINIQTGQLVTSKLSYSDSLTHSTDAKLSIIKVFSNFAMNELLWERPKIKLSDREMNFLRAAQLLNFKYIFKNKAGDVYLANRQPNKGAVDWVFNGPVYLTRLTTLSKDFEFIKWSDEEATLIQGLL